MKIQKNTVVSLTYNLHLDSAEGELIESTNNERPLVFLYGVGMMLPEFEKQLSDKKGGESFAFTLTKEEAYGEYSLDAVVKLPINIFEHEGKIEESLLIEGNVIPMQDNEGNHLNGKVVSVDTDSVQMDFNHPMAGKQLYFTGDILEIREATEEELNHGHVHADGENH